MINGTDVSKWQAVVDWEVAKRAGIQFGFCKATEGGLATDTSDASAIKLFGLDPFFRANWAGMHAAGVVRGAYHFARPDLGNSAIAEAAWFLSRVGPLQPGDLLALDLEPTPPGNWAAWVRDWMAYVHSHTGVWPFFYTYKSGFAKYHVTFQNIGGQSGLWLSAPSDSSFPAPPAGSGWPFVAIWQRAARPIPGVGNVSPDDSDVFNGTLDQLKKYGKPAPVPVPVPPVPVPPVPVPPVPPAPPEPEPVPVPVPPVPPEPSTPNGFWEYLFYLIKKLLGGK